MIFFSILFIKLVLKSKLNSLSGHWDIFQFDNKKASKAFVLGWGFPKKKRLYHLTGAISPK